MSRAEVARVAQVHLAPDRARRVRAELNRFDPAVRDRVREIVRGHAYFEDLLFSFPAALYALGRRDPACATACTATAAVRAGAPLTAIAQALGIPAWLRHLKADAFHGNIPVLPMDADFAQRVGSALPPCEDSARWLAFVAEGYRCCDNTFALWIAHRFGGIGQAAEPGDVRAVALLAWFSQHAETEAAQHIGRGWSWAMGLDGAIEAASDWLGRLEFALFASPVVLFDGAARFVDGFEFVPLDTAAAVYAEAEAMQNCLLDFAQALASGVDQVWGVRKWGQRVAVLHIHFEASGQGLPLLMQVRGSMNGPVECDALHAVYRWLLTWPAARDDISDIVSAGQASLDATQAAYRRLMLPYWRDRGLKAAVPLGDCDTLNTVRRTTWRLTAKHRQRRR